MEMAFKSPVKGVGRTKIKMAKLAQVQKERFLTRIDRAARIKTLAEMKPVVSTKLCWPQKLPVAGWPKKVGANKVISCIQGRVVRDRSNSDEAYSREA